MEAQQIGKAVQIAVASSQQQVSTKTSGPKYIFDWTKVPPRFRGKLLASFRVSIEPDPRRVAINALQENRGLFVTGPTGTGKTHLAVGAAAHFVSECPITYNQNSLPEKFPFEFLPSVEFFLQLKASFSKDDGEEAVLKKYGYPKLLLLDDVGAEKVTDWSRQMFYTLIDRRYRSMKQTIITSNLTLEELANTVDDRIASRIVEMCQVINLSGRDYRISKEPENAAA